MTTPPSIPLVSVCIANYNGENLLPDCIDSVLSQDIDAPVEIIVHDDASTDGSLELLTKRYSQAHVIASTHNVGFCVANNRMADAASGDYLLLLNNDAALDAGALQALLAEASRIAGDAILTLPQHDWETGALVDRGCLLDPFYNPVPNLDSQRTNVAYVIGACLWIPRQLWHELGGFPEWFGSLAEDMYLCCIARLRAVPVYCVDSSGYRHRQGASFGGNRITNTGLHSSYHRRYLSERNRIAVFVVCTPTWLAWLLLVLHVSTLLVEGVLLSLLKWRFRVWRDVYWAALRDAWTYRTLLSAQRRNVQIRRKLALLVYFSAFVLIPRKLVLLLRHGLPRLR